MSANYDILNFLNLTCPSLARLYRTTGISFLPEDFVLDEEKIQERLFFDSLEEEIKYPQIFLGEKREIKKYLKNSQKNMKKIIKNQFFNGFFGKNFENKLKFYFFARQKLTARLMRRFHSYDFDEMRAYREIYHLDPILTEIFSNLFDEEIDLNGMFFSLEQEYMLSYEAKLKVYNAKIAERKKKQAKALMAQALNTKTKAAKTKTAAKTKASEIEAEVLKQHAKNKSVSNTRTAAKKESENLKEQTSKTTQTKIVSEKTKENS